jgi:hypothetical protein
MNEEQAFLKISQEGEKGEKKREENGRGHFCLVV